MIAPSFAETLADHLIGCAMQVGKQRAVRGTETADELALMSKARTEVVQALTIPAPKDPDDEFPSVRDQFAMAAPEIPLWKFKPVMPTPRPEPLPDDPNDPDSMAPNWQEMSAWDAEQVRQTQIQWPYVWADSQMAARKVVTP